jgi:hypothetical protein
VASDIDATLITAHSEKAHMYPDVATAVQAQLSSGPAARAIEHSGQDTVRNALALAVKRRQRDCGVRLDNVFRYLITWT